jgi:hypothetical protein
MDQVKEEYELARKQGKEAEFLKKLGNDELSNQLKSQSVQERIAAAQEKLVSAFEKLSPILEAILTPIADFAGFLSSSKPLMDGIVKGALILAGIKFANFLGLGKSLSGVGGILGGKGATAAGGAAAAAGSVATAAVGGATAAGGAAAVGGATAAGGAAAASSAATGGMFKNLISGAKGLASKLNPASYLKEAVKEAGGAKGLFKNSLKKIPGLNTLLTGFFAYNDIKSLLENPVDENGKPLSKDQINQQVGKIVAGSLGGILGGALGTALGGPIGTIVGSMGGDWLFKNLIGMFPDAAGALGETITPFFEKSPDKADDFIVNDGKMTKFRKDDLIVGGTKLNSGGNNDEVLSALKELISAVKSGGNVYLDGTKIGTAMAVGTYKVQ